MSSWRSKKAAKHEAAAAALRSFTQFKDTTDIQQTIYGGMSQMDIDFTSDDHHLQSSLMKSFESEEEIKEKESKETNNLKRKAEVNLQQEEQP